MQFLDKVGVPVVWQRQVFWSRQRSILSGDSTGAVPGQGYMPVVLVSGADGQTVQKTRGDSTGAVLGQGVHARRCGGPDVQETVGVPQLPGAGCGGVSGNWTPGVSPLVH